MSEKKFNFDFVNMVTQKNMFFFIVKILKIELAWKVFGVNTYDNKKITRRNIVKN